MRAQCCWKAIMVHLLKHITTDCFKKNKKQAGVTNHCKLQVINATVTKNRQVEKAGIAKKKLENCLQITFKNQV